MVEHSLGKGEVMGSSPIISSRNAAVGSKKLVAGCEMAGMRGSNSVVESQPSKLLVAGSIPVSRSRISVWFGSAIQVRKFEAQ